MFTANDIKTVFAYNANANIFRVTPAKRVSWDLRNMDVTNLNAVLSSPLVYAEDFAQLKKQVRAQLKLQGAV
jgi:hypothetical protein